MLIKQAKDKGLNLGAAIDAARRFREQQAAERTLSGRPSRSSPAQRGGRASVGSGRGSPAGQQPAKMSIGRENDRRRVRRADLEQRLQVAELHA